MDTIMVAIYNICVLAFFLGLSITFKHWWIMLFAVFFLAENTERN